MVALAALIPAAVGALTIVAPIAFGLHLILWQPVRRMWRVAVRWHTPFGFLVTFLLATVAAVFVASVIPAGIAFVGAALSRFSIERSEFLADEAVADLGLGPQLLAALETAIEAGHADADRTSRPAAHAAPDRPPRPTSP